MQPRTILVYIDTLSARPLQWVQQCITQTMKFATAHNARIILCDGVMPPSGYEGSSGLHERLMELRRRYAVDTLNKLCGTLTQQLDIDVVVFKGKPLLGIVQLVITRSVDLVVCVPPVGSGGGLDSTALHLLRKCPAPVWIMRQSVSHKPSKIAIAVDRDIFPASDQPQAMANQLLEAAITIARPGPAELHLVHAWEVYGVELLPDIGSELSSDEIEHYRETQRYAHTMWLQQMHDQLRRKLAARGERTIQSEVHLVEGQPSAVLPAWLRSVGADLLVLGTLGSSAIPGLLIGTNAETIIASCEIPLLALKPSGFRSPLVTSAHAA